MTTRSFEESVRLLEDRINLERLQSFEPQAMEGRLDILRQILAALGRPETAYRTVHIAGTKGKGSTCALLESIFLEHGWRVGRYTSPHLYHFTERLMVDGVPCPPEEFTELFFSVYDQIELDTFQTLTYFELLTLLAFVYFAQKEVDVVILEVGLGGRLDATNICQPDVSVITSISYDHILQLGPTLSHIAAEKSGIIKPGIPVITTVLHTESQDIIREKAKSVGAPLFVLNEHFFVRYSRAHESSRYTFRYDVSPPKFSVKLSLESVSLKMPGSHQVRNASAAISAFLLLHQEKQTLDAQKIKEGLQKSFLPLRGEVIRLSENSPTILLDGAHNRASMRSFIKTAVGMFPKRRLLCIFGASMGKDVEGMFIEISGYFYHIFLTQTSDSSRRFPPQGLRLILASSHSEFPHGNQKDNEDYFDTSISVLTDGIDTVLFPSEIDREIKGITVVENCKDALKQCLQMATPQDVICITGSLYLTAELRKYVLENAASDMFQ